MKKMLENEKEVNKEIEIKIIEIIVKINPNFVIVMFFIPRI